METQQAESVNTNVSNQKAVKPAKDSTNLVLGILCIILCAGIFALLYMYMNLNSEYQDINGKYIELTNTANDISAKNDNDTEKETNVTVPTDTDHSTTMKNFSFILTDKGSDAPDVKFTGEMPTDFTIDSKEVNLAKITSDGFFMSFSAINEDEWGPHDNFQEINTNGLGKLAFVENTNSIEDYKYQKKYVSMNEYFRTSGQCEIYGEKVDAPCGPNMIYVMDGNSTKYLFYFTCNTNSQTDFQTCHDIVKSIKFEEVN